MFTLKNGDGMVWPDGKRIAVMVTFDFDAELLRKSVIGKRTIGFSDTSRGQYGPDEGLKRCLDMLERQQLKTTFFVPGRIAVLDMPVVYEGRQRYGADAGAAPGGFCRAGWFGGGRRPQCRRAGHALSG